MQLTLSRDRNHTASRSEPSACIPVAKPGRRYGISFRPAARRGLDRLLLGSIEQVGAALLSGAGAPTAFVPARYWHVSPCNRVATTRKRTQELKPAATRTLPRPTAEPADRAGIAPTGRRYRPLTSSPRGAADVLSQCHGGAVALIDFYRSGRAYTGIPRRFPVRRRWHRSAFQVAFFHTLIN